MLNLFALNIFYSYFFKRIVHGLRFVNRQEINPLELLELLERLETYRYLLTNFSARHLLFFSESDICFGDDHLMFAFICVKESNSLFWETALFVVKVARVSSQ